MSIARPELVRSHFERSCLNVTEQKGLVMFSFDRMVGKRVRADNGNMSYDGTLIGRQDSSHISTGPTQTEEGWRLELDGGVYIFISPTRHRIYELTAPEWKD